MAPPVLRLTVSPLNTPTSVALRRVESGRGAGVVYLVLGRDARDGETAGVMLAVVIGWVSV